MNSKISLKKEKDEEHVVINDSDDNKSNENSDNDSDKKPNDQYSESCDNVDKEKEVVIANKKVHFSKREEQANSQSDDQLGKRVRVLKHIKKSHDDQKVRATKEVQPETISGTTAGATNELKFKLNSIDSKLNLLNLKLNSLDTNKIVDKLNNIIGERLDELTQKIESLALVRPTKPEKSIFNSEQDKSERRPQPPKKIASYAPSITQNSGGNVSYGQKRRKN